MLHVAAVTVLHTVPCQFPAVPAPLAAPRAWPYSLPEYQFAQRAWQEVAKHRSVRQKLPFGVEGRRKHPVCAVKRSLTKTTAQLVARRTHAQVLHCTCRYCGDIVGADSLVGVARQ